MTHNFQNIRLFILNLFLSLDFTIAASASAKDLHGNCDFTGRWRIDTASLNESAKPNSFKVKNGYFQRNENSMVKSDGRPHSIKSDGYVDEVTIFIDNDKRVKEVDKIRGKLAYISIYEVSPDGNTLKTRIANYTSPDGKAILGETSERRVGMATKGSHLLSGTWKRISMTVDANDDWLMKLAGGRFSWRKEGGSGYEAEIGGGPVILEGDNAGIRAQVTRPRCDTIVETDLATDGTVVDILSMKLMPDGKTITATAVYDSLKKKSVFTLHRVEY